MNFVFVNIYIRYTFLSFIRLGIARNRIKQYYFNFKKDIFTVKKDVYTVKKDVFILKKHHFALVIIFMIVDKLYSSVKV